jgi:hypothetical protein
MAREITDAEGVAWSCIQAFAGLGTSLAKEEAALVPGAPDRVQVVCTPKSGARSIRLELQWDWEGCLADQDILQRMQESAGDQRGDPKGRGGS